MTQPVDAITLDVGGPLYTDENFVVAMLGALDELRSEHGLSTVDRVSFRSVYDDLRQRQAGGLRRAMAAEFLGDAALAGLLHERLGPRWVHPEGSLYADVLPALRQLHGRVRIAILANQEAAVVDALRRDGVADFVDVWGVSAVVGFEKPDPRLFEWVLAELGASADRTVHIGNRLDTDVRPARSMGMRAVWVLRGEAPDDPTAEQRAEADGVVRSLAELPAVLTGLAEGVR